MNKLIKSKPLSLDELKQWKNNPLINPRTNKTIKKDATTYKLIEKEYNKNKNLIESCILTILNKLLECDDDRDPISMNLFWTEKNNVKNIVYPLEELDKLVFYTDGHNKIRCLEKDTISHLKTYNILNHPVTMDLLPQDLFETIIPINLENKKVSLDDFALNVFQIFTKKSIFIDYKLFMELDKNKLLTFNHEVKDIWVQNLTVQQRETISEEILFHRTNLDLQKNNLEDIQKYLLENLKIALECDKEDLLLMINYIIIGALGIVIPVIKENYSDVIFGF
jgi:hypothetical protein